MQAPGLSKKRLRASLSDLSSLEEVEAMSVRQLKEILARNFVSYSGCCEKWELVERVSRLYKESAESQKPRRVIFSFSPLVPFLGLQKLHCSCYKSHLFLRKLCVRLLSVN